MKQTAPTFARARGGFFGAAAPVFFGPPKEGGRRMKGCGRLSAKKALNGKGVQSL
jgi:hypothetical protein